MVLWERRIPPIASSPVSWRSGWSWSSCLDNVLRGLGRLSWTQADDRDLSVLCMSQMCQISRLGDKGRLGGHGQVQLQACQVRIWGLSGPTQIIALGSLDWLLGAPGALDTSAPSP